MTVLIGFYASDSNGNILLDDRGQPLLTEPLPGIPDPYGYDSRATWAERFNNGQALSYVAYEPIGQVLQAVYISGAVVNLPGIPVNVRTALLLAADPEQYLLQLISVVAP